MNYYFIGLWLFVFLAALIIEACTQNLVSIWFATGATAALACAVFKTEFWVQLVVFLGVSGLFLACLYPFIRKRIAVKRTPTNADRIIGKDAIVTREIDALHESGEIRVMGVVWSAKTTESENISVGERVRIEKIDGVKAIVTRKEIKIV